MSSVLVAPASIKEQVAHADSEALQKAHARITADLQNIVVVRTLLLADEDDAARTVGEHKKVGTFGYQVWNDEGTQLTKLLDETGND